MRLRLNTTTGRSRVTRLAAGFALVALPATALAATSGPALAAAHPARSASTRATGAAVAGDISTVAGGVGGPGPATGVATPSPCGVTFGGGALYAATSPMSFGLSGTVREVSRATGRLTTPAGYAGPGVGGLGDGGPATAAGLESCSIAVDHSGNLVIVDWANKRIRVVAKTSGMFYGQAMTAGNIYTVAGETNGGYGSTGVPATQTGLNDPQYVAVDPHGNLVIADLGTQYTGLGQTLGARIRVVAATTGRFYGQAMTAGNIYTVAGFKSGGTFAGLGGTGREAALGVNLGGIRVDSAGNVLFTDDDVARVLVLAEKTGSYYGQAMTSGHLYSIAGDGEGGFSGDGGPATAAELSTPGGLAVDNAGNVVLADTGNGRIRVIAESSGTFYDQAMTAGNIYTVAGDGGSGFAGDGGPATSAEFNQPTGVAVDPSGNLLVADSDNARVRVVAEASGSFYGQAMTTGDVYTVMGNGYTEYSGDGGLATSAQLDSPTDVAVDANDDVAVADSANYRVRLIPASSGALFGRQMTAGHIYTVSGNGTEPQQPGCNGKAAATQPEGSGWIAMDGSGNLVISENSQICVVPATSGTYYGQAMTAGHIYPLAGDGTAGYSGDGGPATQAEISTNGVAIDHAGNLVLADTGNDRIRVVAESSGMFYGLAMTAGDIYTVAGDGTAGSSGNGGPATSAELREPESVAVDGSGNLVIADSGNSVIRAVAESPGTFYGVKMKTGDIYTVAGNGSGVYGGDGGPATQAGLEFPMGVAVDGSGNLVISDSDNERVRVVAGLSGTFYGQAMTVGDIYGLAGDGSCGITGDGGPGTSAEICYPEGVAVDPAGDVLFADQGASRVRMISG
jgi:trimeric autotransporter adhesin